MSVSPLSTRVGWSQPQGLRVEFEADGTLRTLALGGLNLNLFPGNALEGGPTNLLLRRHGSPATESTWLLGPRSSTSWSADASSGCLDGVGDWRGIEYRICLRLARDLPAWFWHVELRNTGDVPVRLDLVYLQDLALAPFGAIRSNEYYVSQYIDHAPLEHDTSGVVIASRQNQAVGAAHPWSLIGSLHRGVGYATDALQVHGLTARAGQPSPVRTQGLPSVRLQHEHSMVALQDEAIELAAGASASRGFFGLVVPDHPDATSAADLPLVQETLDLAEARPPADHRADPAAPGAPLPASLFATAPLLAALELDDAAVDRLFGPDRRHVERDATGRLMSFFTGADRHVALKAKELAVLRPHGQVLRTGTASVPDESALASTVWMGGVFHSMLTQGHVGINRCLSTVRSYLGLFRSQGLRVFVEIDGRWCLLDQPSAFEMTPYACRWVYVHDTGRIEVTSRARSAPHALGLDIEVVEGQALRCLVCLHVSLGDDDGSTTGSFTWSLEGGRVVLAPGSDSQLGRRFPQGRFMVEPVADTAIEQVGGDETLFPDARTRQVPCVTIRTAPARAARFLLQCDLVLDGPDVPSAEAPGPGNAKLVLSVPVRAEGEAAEALRTVTDLLPWLEQNALVHFLAPRGLEQFTGGGWGTRDVCQGPLEYLFAQGQHDAVRAVLLRIMKAQRANGDWPQWFMFFERDAAIRADDSNGDIVLWPLLAIGQYLVATGDRSLLEERVPFHATQRASRRPAVVPTVWQHVLRALALTRRRTIAGTALAAYGHGDWNDALQPADPTLRDNMCSAWTVALHHQALTTLARGLRGIGRRPAAARLERHAFEVRRDFQRLLVVDGVLCGYAIFGAPGSTTPSAYLLHPRDATTGVHYSLLAMIQAITEGLMEPAAMGEHLRLIDEHLMGPDGARLFDKPMTYRGGPQRQFQRAESATFFGREIGLMYTHAHLRYAQALAHVGDAERFFRALRQASPIGLGAIVPSAAPRPANAYYSSSDAAFADRYEASDHYGRVRDGTVALEGGWRVYSSGAGILYGLVVRHGFGLRLEADALVIDPVLPVSLDGLGLRITLGGVAIDVDYRVGAPGAGVTGLTLDDRPLPFVEEINPYRRGGARVSIAALGNGRDGGPRRLSVSVGTVGG